MKAYLREKVMRLKASSWISRNQWLQPLDVKSWLGRVTGKMVVEKVREVHPPHKIPENNSGLGIIVSIYPWVFQRVMILGEPKNWEKKSKLFLGKKWCDAGGIWKKSHVVVQGWVQGGMCIGTV